MEEKNKNIDINENLISNKEKNNINAYNNEKNSNDFKNFKIKYESTQENEILKEKNEITTSKYNYFNFIFKILLEQFSQSANMYFLILGILSVRKI
jgi:hypothetical protein